MQVEVRGQCSEDLDLSFYHVGPRDQTQVISPGGKCLYRLSHLTRPYLGFSSECAMSQKTCLGSCKAGHLTVCIDTVYSRYLGGL